MLPSKVIISLERWSILFDCNSLNLVEKWLKSIAPHIHGECIVTKAWGPVYQSNNLQALNIPFGWNIILEHYPPYNHIIIEGFRIASWSFAIHRNYHHAPLALRNTSSNYYVYLPKQLYTYLFIHII